MEGAAPISALRDQRIAVAASPNTQPSSRITSATAISTAPCGSSARKMHRHRADPPDERHVHQLRRRRQPRRPQRTFGSATGHRRARRPDRAARSGDVRKVVQTTSAPSLPTHLLPLHRRITKSLRRPKPASAAEIQRRRRDPTPRADRPSIRPSSSRATPPHGFRPRSVRPGMQCDPTDRRRRRAQPARRPPATGAFTTAPLPLPDRFTALPVGRERVGFPEPSSRHSTLAIRLDSRDADPGARFAISSRRQAQGLRGRRPHRHGIIADVRARGDEALYDLTEKFDRVDLRPTGLRVTADEIAAAKVRAGRDLTPRSGCATGSLAPRPPDAQDVPHRRPRRLETRALDGAGIGRPHVARRHHDAIPPRC